MRGIDAVLNLRGWQVFATLLLIAAVGSAVTWYFAFWKHLFPPEATLVVALFEAVYFGWMLWVSAAMNVRVPPQVRRGMTVPVLGFCVTVAYLSILLPWFWGADPPPPFTAIWLALHLLAMVVNFYLLWFVSRSVVLAESNGMNVLPRTLQTFLALWFTAVFPVGAWWVQERARTVAGRGGASNQELQRR